MQRARSMIARSRNISRHYAWSPRPLLRNTPRELSARFTENPPIAEQDKFKITMKLRNQLTRVFQSVMLVVLATNVGLAQTRPAARRTAPVRNPAIAKVVPEIDARNIEATIRKLVSFGTLNTLSEQNDPKRGIGAARDWLYAEFLKAAEASGGRMTVEKQSYKQAKAP